MIVVAEGFFGGGFSGLSWGFSLLSVSFIPDVSSGVCISGLGFQRSEVREKGGRRIFTSGA